MDQTTPGGRTVAHTGCPWCVGEPKAGDEVAIVLHGLLDEGGVDVGDAELGASEDLELVLPVSVPQRNPTGRAPRAP